MLSSVCPPFTCHYSSLLCVSFVPPVSLRCLYSIVFSLPPPDSLTLNDNLTHDVIHVHLRHLHVSASICLLCGWAYLQSTQPPVWTASLAHINIFWKRGEYCKNKKCICRGNWITAESWRTHLPRSTNIHIFTSLWKHADILGPPVCENTVSLPEGCVRLCDCVGMYVRGSRSCDVMRNVCLPVGLSLGLPATPNAANEGAFARVCVHT